MMMRYAPKAHLSNFGNRIIANPARIARTPEIVKLRDAMSLLSAVISH